MPQIEKYGTTHQKSSNTPIISTAPSVKIITPNDGESLYAGIKTPIQWSSTNIPANKRLKLFFSKNNGKNWSLIRGGLKINGSIQWKPNKKRLTDQGLIKVCLPKSKKSTAVCDVSDTPFSILLATPSVTITNPNAMDTILVGETMPIQWSSSNIPAKKRLKLFFSKNNGKKWSLIRSGLKINGSMQWKPNKNRRTDQGLLKVCLSKLKKSAAVCDVIDTPISIL